MGRAYPGGGFQAVKPSRKIPHALPPIDLGRLFLAVSGDEQKQSPRLHDAGFFSCRPERLP